MAQLRRGSRFQSGAARVQLQVAALAKQHVVHQAVRCERQPARYQKTADIKPDHGIAVSCDIALARIIERPRNRNVRQNDEEMDVAETSTHEAGDEDGRCRRNHHQRQIGIAIPAVNFRSLGKDHLDRAQKESRDDRVEMQLDGQ